MERHGLRRGFGSVRVRATIGSSTRTTPIFPGSQSGYVLPVKPRAAGQSRRNRHGHAGLIPAAGDKRTEPPDARRFLDKGIVYFRWRMERPAFL
jgi:hypothetical protein